MARVLPRRPKLDRFFENNNSNSGEIVGVRIDENTFSKSLKGIGATITGDRSRGALAELRRQMLLGQQPEIQAIRVYHRKRTRANLIRLLETVAHVPGSGGIAEKLRACSSKKRCRLYVCPTCGGRLQRKAVLEALKELVAKHGKMPTLSEISFVTIRGFQTDLEPGQAMPWMKRLKARLREVQKGMSLRGTSWSGWIDISASGVVHFHGLVLHPNVSASKLQAAIQVGFRAPRAVKVSRWKGRKPLVENLASVMKYALPAGRHTKLVKDLPSLGIRSAEAIARRLVCLRDMAGRGIRGLRFQVNLDTPRFWIAGVLYDPVEHRTIIIPEMEEMILLARRTARRRARLAWFQGKVDGKEESQIAS